MAKKILFVIAGLLLCLSAFGKVYLLRTKTVTVMGGFLGHSSIPLYWVLWAAAAVEFALAGCALFSPSRRTAYSLAYLGAIFTAYRLVVMLFDFHAPCTCLGDFPQLLGLGKGADQTLSWLVYLVYIAVATSLVLLSAGKRQAAGNVEESSK